MKQGERELSLKMVNCIKSKMPVTFPNHIMLDISNIEAHIPEANYSIDNQLRMKETGSGSTEGSISATVHVKDQHGNEIAKKSFKSLFTFPVKTGRGTFIVNGVEKNILSQMRLKSGVYTSNDDAKGVVKTAFMFSRKNAEKYMPPINFVFNTIDNTFLVDIGGYKSMRLNIVNFLHIIGFTDMEIQASLGNDMFAEAIINKYQKTKTSKITADLFKALYPKGVEEGHVTEDRMKALIFEYFSKNATFEKKSKVVEATLGVKNMNYMTKEVISKAVKKTMSVGIGLVKEDVKDDLKYKDVYNDTDLIMEAFENDFDNFIEEVSAVMEAGSVGTDRASWIMNALGKASACKSIKELMSSDLTRSSEETNPLFMESLLSTVTQLGAGGISKDSKRNEERARNLSPSGINRIDPVHTPESDNIGLTEHLTVGAKIEDNTIKAPYYKVINGAATINEKKIIYMESVDEEKHVIAFHDTKYVSREGDKLIFKTDMVPARYMGKTDMYPVGKIEFIDSSSNSVLGTAANLIPFVSHNDGARVLMGANMQGQAINLVNREVPLVSTLADKNSGATFNEKVGKEHGKPILSNVNGVVDKITDSTIVVIDKKGKEHVFQYHKYYPLNQSFINNELKVKVGDTVTAGQMLAEGWQTVGGSLALGVNTRVGFLPYKGYNYEDGVVIADSYAKKMTTEESKQIEFEIKKDFIGGRGSGVKKELSAHTISSAVNNLDNDGIIRVGEYVKAGSVVVAGLKEISKDDGGLTGLDVLRFGGETKLKKVLKYSEIQIPQSYVEGKVVRISVVDNPDAAHKQKIIVTIVSQKPLIMGDKIVGRHGNKGTITKILPDELMPTTKDGKPLELLFSPLAVPSRKNVGQILETNAGLIAEKTGKPYVVDNFNHNEKERVLEELKNIGCPEGKVKVMLKEEDDEGNIVDVPVENDVTVGSMYIMKLKHKVDEKIQSRSNIETYITDKEHMPGKTIGSEAGEKGNPQSMGEMEMRVLQANGAVWNLLESTTIKSDGGGTRDARTAMYRAMATGNLDSADLKSSASPETMKVMSDYLKTIGFNVKPMHYGKEVNIDKPFDSIGIAPLNGEEFVKSIGADKEVFKAGGALRARQLLNNIDENGNGVASKGTNNKRPETENGLIDPKIFGDSEVDDDKEMRSKWGYIKLATPVPNPVLFEAVSDNPYAILTGMKKSELKKINEGHEAIVVDPAEFIKTLDVDDKEKADYMNFYAQGLQEAGLDVGSIVPVSMIDKFVEQGMAIPAKTGGEAISHMLSGIDVDSALEEAKATLDMETTTNGMKQGYKKVRCLEMLKNNNLKANDLMVKYVPVAPTYLRPIHYQDSKNQIIDDLNKIYDKIILASNNAKNGNVLTEDGFVDTVRSDVKSFGSNSSSIYKALARLDGTVKTTDRTGSELVTAMGNSTTPGVMQGKDGLFRGKMLSKRLDFSGRSVIGVDPNLNLNEVGLPMDMAKSLYKPFIIKEIMKRGITEPTESAALAKLNKMDSEVKSIIQDVVNDRPVLLNRQPSLHKFGIQAFKPIIKDYEDGKAVRVIQLNPLVVTGFNADFDGDSSVNSILSRKVIIDVETNNDYNCIEGCDEKMPFDGDTKIRYKYGVTNLRDFPRGELIKESGNKEVYKVPSDIEVLTVWNGEKKWCPVESFSVHKDLDMLEVMTNTSRTMHVSNDHSLVTVDENLDYKRYNAEMGMTVPRLREVITNDNCQVISEIEISDLGESKYTFKRNSLKLDYGTGYLLGAYIGDGWVSNEGNSHAICLASDKKEIPDFIKIVMKDYFTEDLHISSTPNPHEYKGYSAYSEKHTWYSKTFAAFIKQHIGSGAENKHLPEFWMHSNDKFKWGLMAGLTDTDGSVSISKKGQCNINYTTISRVLAYEYVALAHTLDLTASMTITQTPQGRECYVVTLSQDSVKKAQKRMMLQARHKKDALSKATFKDTYARNKYTPKLSKEKLVELRRSIGSPRTTNLEGEELAKVKKQKSFYSIIYRVEKNNTAIPKDTALELFKLKPELFNDDGFWSKWKSMVLDETIEWELITNIKPIPFITEAYDLTIPPVYTMVTESGFVIYDTMAVHVPVTEKAKEEAKELMLPTQNLINPTDGTFVIEIRHEMALGLFQLTKTWKAPQGTPLPYNNPVQLRKDYIMGKVSSDQAIVIPICPHPTTVGHGLFNWILPDKLAHYRDFKKAWDKKSISAMIMNIYKEAEKGEFKNISRVEIATMLDKLKKIGFEASTRSGVSIGSSDFTKLKEISTTIEKAKKKGITKEEWSAVEDDLKKSINDGLLGDDNPLHVMMKSGARASAGQVLKMVGMVGTGMDITKKSIDPIASSHFDGLSPQEYFRLGYDSRKGMYDRAVSTSAPGKLTRDVWAATQDVVVKEADCKTKEYIMIKKSDPTVKGRYAGVDILDKSGKVLCKKNQMITNEIYAAVYSDDTIDYIGIRSPLRCKVPSGVCQKCYGALAGTNNVVKLGTAVGVLASQALGEPATQMTMNTFHTGGANSAATLGLPRVESILNLSKTIKTNKAVIADNDGLVTNIEDKPMNITVTVDKKKYVIQKPLNSPAPTLRVKVGDMVHPGDFITVGSKEDINDYMDDKKTQIVFTNASPKDLFEKKKKYVGQEKALDYTRDYLTDSMQYAVKKSDQYMDRRHAETIIAKLTSVSMVTDAGDSPFMKGQEIETKTVNRWNELNCKPKSISVANKADIIGKVSSVNVKAPNGQVIVKAGQVIDTMIADILVKSGVPSVKVSLRPAQVKMNAETGKNTVWYKGHDNWLSNSTVEAVKQQVTRGAVLGQVDKLEDPRARLISGNMVNVGEGLTMPEPIANGMKNSLLNFFSPTLDSNIEKLKKGKK